MRLVVDANILFSYFKKKSSTRDLIISNPDLEMYVPSFIFKELEKYRDVIIKKAKIDERKFNIIIKDLKNITLKMEINEIKGQWENALNICPDPDDVQYFATALELGCAIWSNDKRLKNQDDVVVLNTKEILSMLSDTDHECDNDESNE